MTQPHLPPSPWHPTITPPVSTCCGTVLKGEACDCSELLASWAGAPVYSLRPHAPGLTPLVDPALREVA
ncbi:hypothetical protein EYA84_25335 [Verrucosispora sp. SN26_14.1]|uniref:hypothetical protein n=1 Tax=Verrucosispora sp. SN26_14.1 TaxID=2527879 RepID=UPI0010349040|nr:hypothetical protein [Verrucosispora sp. SN26_14.1]TBL29077.1 hypothetical protein EYA84_25335 [Verrucosispora sp. SN26_14.1]